jgi:3'-phosphoadenosine 5'-phosphosulfate sulfotransferase
VAVNTFIKGWDHNVESFDGRRTGALEIEASALANATLEASNCIFIMFLLREDYLRSTMKADRICALIITVCSNVP